VNETAKEYLCWYYNTGVWKATEFLGVPCLKSVCDLWNYQEILSALRPGLIVEFGAYNGGSTLFFAVIGGLLNPNVKVLSFEIDTSRLHPLALADTRIRFVNASSVDPSTAEQIRATRNAKTEPAFFVLDSNHEKAHVLRELELLRDITQPGDYVVVEDGVINGNPVLPGWGEGPYEALQQYRSDHPGDYSHDKAREEKFGWTFALGGFLIRL
jgi:cephalosporin hydroxylase